MRWKKLWILPFLLVICGTCPIFAESAESYKVYRSLWSLHEKGMTRESMLVSKELTLDEKRWEPGDRIHFCVHWLNMAIQLDNKEERDKAEKYRVYLINSSEDAFWEFRSYYDC